MNAADIAALFDDLEPPMIPLLFRLLPKELAADTFVEMESDQQQLLIKGFSDSELKEVVDELYIDDAVDIVEEMPANVVKRILMQADPDTRKMINELLQYPEDSAAPFHRTGGGFRSAGTTKALSKKSGLSNSQVTSILTLLAPLLLTMIGNNKKDDDDDGSSLGGLLGGLLGSSSSNSSAGLLGSLLSGDDTAAVRLYKKSGFVDSGYVDEDNPDSVNLICSLF